MSTKDWVIIIVGICIVIALVNFVQGVTGSNQPLPPEDFYGAPNVTEWHRTYGWDQYWVGQMGSMSYILDHNGKPISEGFHEFHREGGLLIGERGAMSYILSDEGKTLSSGYHKFERMSDGSVMGILGGQKDVIYPPKP